MGFILRFFAGSLCLSGVHGFALPSHCGLCIGLIRTLYVGFCSFLPLLFSPPLDWQSNRGI